MRPTPTIATVIIYLIIIYLLPVFFPELTASFGKEDGVVESIGALFFLAASVLLIGTYFKIKKTSSSEYRKPEAIWILGLALLFFVAFGEEISWGQRIYGFETPDALKEINKQHEFNIHNLEPFHGLDEKGEPKTGIAALMTSHRLFYAILIGYIIIIPLIMIPNNWLSRLIIKLEIPIVPLWISGLFLSVFLFVKVIQFMFARDNNDLYHALVEIMETNIALVILLLSLAFYQSKPLPKKA
jgi:hypothetical protein